MDNIKDTVENVLNMSRYNPVFGRESQRVLELVDSMLYKGDLDQHVASSYSDKIIAKRQGKIFADIQQTFDAYNQDYIGTGNKFVLFEHGVSEFLHARNICRQFIDFYTMANKEGYYKPNNPHIVNLLKNISQKSLECTKTNDEMAWYYIYTLQELLVSNIKNLKIYGEYITVFQKVLLACLVENLKRVKPYFDKFESKGLVEKMDLFGTTKSFREYDTEMAKVTALSKFFISNKELTDFGSEFNNKLINEYSEGKITKEQYRYINANINSYIYYLNNSENTKVYSPILTFMFGDGDNTLMHKYDATEMHQAFKFALDFYKTLSEDTIATAILQFVVTTARNYESQGLATREQSNDNIIGTLNMLLQQGVIDGEKYERYKAQIT